MLLCFYCTPDLPDCATNPVKCIPEVEILTNLSYPCLTFTGGRNLKFGFDIRPKFFLSRRHFEIRQHILNLKQTRAAPMIDLSFSNWVKFGSVGLSLRKWSYNFALENQPGYSVK